MASHNFYNESYPTNDRERITHTNTVIARFAHDYTLFYAANVT